MKRPSNYPPGVTGNEPEIVGQDESPEGLANQFFEELPLDRLDDFEFENLREIEVFCNQFMIRMRDFMFELHATRNEVGE